MNPITHTAYQLEKEALSLYDALRQHRSLYARKGLSKVAWRRYERRTPYRHGASPLEDGQLMRWPTITTVATCQHCDGEGLTTITGRGSFDTHAEQWYPNEETMVCLACDGTGEELVTQCRICIAIESDCCCSEDDLDGWYSLEAAVQR